ncbi:polysaccharide deacetylase family protein [Geomobilimonas luticola]|uniref:polysaccharide deacetylase family protein n=1 Tax=Geomobilimonas luticola TaxID=1114878 RepID=UPI001FE7D922|nr:polysaccharide deacetylase family protein [Geomobilimonas luticola]
MTIDVEDWYHVCGEEERGASLSPERRVRRNVELILDLLAEEGCMATFFMLGSVAEQEPELLPLIASAGHEIASHGYSHRLVPELGATAFREELRRTAGVIERQARVVPAGFRAPRWSLSRETPWAFDILAEEGYLYDSSLNPLPFVGDRLGARLPFRRGTSSGDLLELPPLVTGVSGFNLPTGGGWGLRFFPLPLIGATIEKLNRQGAPAVLYLHPRELDPFGPRLELAPLISFAVYGPRTDVRKRLRHLLRRFRFGTMYQLVEQWQSA